MIDTDSIRAFVKNAYVVSARSRGEKTVSIPVKAVEDEMKKGGLPTGRTPMVCSALRGRKFQKENGLVLDHWDGPPSGQSTTVVFHYRFVDEGGPAGVQNLSLASESAAQRARRLTEKLQGLMKDEIAAHGGTEGYMRWVRSDENDAA